MDIPKILLAIRPTETCWSCGDGYKSLEWHPGATTPKPTLAECEAAWPATKAAIDKEVFNAPIITQLAALDLKRIRPLAEGDTVYLANLNTQIVALRSKLT